MGIDELDLIEELHQIQIKNKEELVGEILNKAKESDYTVLQLCSVVNLYVAQSGASGELEVPLEIIKEIR
ncbi:MAG: hypothetical protein FJ150_06000 [Euryarchaeota archaeon]|nr:hypothetical protein [Euryarchaeota archaeon]